MIFIIIYLVIALITFIIGIYSGIIQAKELNKCFKVPVYQANFWKTVGYAIAWPMTWISIGMIVLVEFKNNARE